MEWFYRENTENTAENIGLVVTLEEKLNKILSSTSEL